MNVRQIIKESGQKIKQEASPLLAPAAKVFREKKEEILFSGIVILVAISSFALGRGSIKDEAEAASESPAASAVSTLASHKSYSSSGTSNGATSADGFIASKSGTKYYPSDCVSAKRISAKNKVFFATEEAAKAKGYSRASNCQFN